MGSSERGFTIERKCQFSGKKLKSLQHLQTHPNMTNISNKQLIMSYVQFYHHKVWQIYFWNHKRDRFWHSKIPFCKTSNLEMKERFNQKLQENKPPLTLQNTYLKVCLKMRRAFLVFFYSRHRTLLDGTRDRWNILLAPESHKCNIMIADFIREQALLWIQVDSLSGLLKSTPQPPCSACRADIVGIETT